MPDISRETREELRRLCEAAKLDVPADLIALGKRCRAHMPALLDQIDTQAAEQDDAKKAVQIAIDTIHERARERDAVIIERDALRALLDEAAKGLERVEGLRSALRFILAFYEPGQRHLDTEAWKHAESSGRLQLAEAEKLGSIEALLVRLRTAVPADGGQK